MKILYSKRMSVSSISPNKCNKTKNINFKGEPNKVQSSLSCSATYNLPLILRKNSEKKGLSELAKKPKTLSEKAENNLDIEKISKLKIPNFCITNYNGIRGESLSSPKNRKFLKPLKSCGVTSVIDLREKFANNNFKNMCEDVGLEFFKFPINSFGVPDEVVIQNMPKLFDCLDKGNYYIACAQGLHRTDIALALNYMFNPKVTTPPYLIGHVRDNQLKTEDINRRLNSIFKNLTEENLHNFGWKQYDEKTFSERKKEMYSMNKNFFKVE